MAGVQLWEDVAPVRRLKPPIWRIALRHSQAILVADLTDPPDLSHDRPLCPPGEPRQPAPPGPTMAFYAMPWPPGPGAGEP